MCGAEYQVERDGRHIRLIQTKPPEKPPKLAPKPSAKTLPTAQAIGCIAVLIIAWVALIVFIKSEMAASREAAPKIQRIIQEVRSLGQVAGFSAKPQRPLRPWVGVTVASSALDEPPFLANAELLELSPISRFIFRLKYNPRSIPSPSDIATVVVVADSIQPTGRMIALDIGSVPEFVHKARVFAVDRRTNRVVWWSRIITGGGASKPFPGPGGGVLYVSELTGPRVDDLDIARAVKAIPFD